MPASGHQDHTPSPSASAPLVSRHRCVHRIPLPTSVTIAIRPSCGGGTAGREHNFCFPEREIKYLCTDNCNPDQLESARKIRFYLTSNSELADRMRGANQAKMHRLIARRANQAATVTACRAALVSLTRGPVVLPSSSIEHVDERRRTL